MPIPHASAVPLDLSALATSQGSPRKGKRKRTEDEEDDDAENRTLHTSAAHQDDAVSVTHPDQDGFRGSVAPSVGESTSEGDWLMAAIGEGSNEEDGPDVPHRPPHDIRMVNGKLRILLDPFLHPVLAGADESSLDLNSGNSPDLVLSRSRC